jgi:hypothetical protein
LFGTKYLAVPNGTLVVTLSIDTMELLDVQGPKSIIEAVGDYLCMDGRLEEKVRSSSCKWRPTAAAVD